MSDTPEIKLVKTSRGSTYRMKKKEIVRVQKSNLTLPYEVGKLLRGLAMPQKKAYCLLLIEGSWTLQSIANELLCHRQTVLDYTRSKEAQDAGVLASVWDLPIPKLPRVVVGEVYEKDVVEPDADVLKRLLELQPLAQKVRSYSPKFREEAEEYTKLLADEIGRGVTVYQLSKELGITIGAINFRLTRYGYKPLGTGKSKAYNAILEQNRPQ